MKRPKDPTDHTRYAVAVAFLIIFVGIFFRGFLEKAAINRSIASHINKTYQVIPDNDGVGRIGTYLALENTADKSWETFVPCTKDQNELRPGDIVTFESNNAEIPKAQFLGFRPGFNNPNCYLKVASKNSGDQ